MYSKGNRKAPCGKGLGVFFPGEIFGRRLVMLMRLYHMQLKTVTMRNLNPQRVYDDS